jgi:hypothetical protein
MKKNRLLSVIMHIIKMQTFIIKSLPPIREEVNERRARARAGWMILNLYFRYIRRKRDLYRTKFIKDSALNKLAFVVHVSGHTFLFTCTYYTRVYMHVYVSFFSRIYIYIYIYMYIHAWKSICIFYVLINIYTYVYMYIYIFHIYAWKSI